MNQRRGRAAAVLATLALTLGLSTTSFADVLAGLILDPTTEGSFSTEGVTGPINGGSGSGVGVLISDTTLPEGGSGSATYSGTVDVVTSGQNGGAGVLVRSYSKPVKATIEGSVSNKDESISGTITNVARGSAGIAAMAFYAGDVTLKSSANVSVTGTTAGLDPNKAPVATGVLLYANKDDEQMYTHYYEENGVKIPVEIDNTGGASHFTISEKSAWIGNEWNNVPIEDLYVIFDGNPRNTDSTWDLYLITEDGTVFGRSKEKVPAKDWYWFRGTDIKDPKPYGSETTDGTITVTLENPDNPDGDGIEVTIVQTDEGGALLGGYDANLRRLIVKDSQDKDIDDVEAGDVIIFCLEEGGPTRTLVTGNVDEKAIKVDAELSGSITARAEGNAPEAAGLYAYSLTGSIVADLRDLSITSSALRSVGIYSRAAAVNTITGNGNVTIDVTATGDTPAPTGILTEASGVSDSASVVSITGSGNSLNVQTDGYASPSNVKQLTRGISSLTMGVMNPLQNLVRFEGPITVGATEGGAYGIYSQAAASGKGTIEVIGDITINAEAGSAVYTQAQGIFETKEYRHPVTGVILVPAMKLVPELSDYVRGNIIFNNAGDSVFSIAAYGGTIVVDGDVTVSGPGTRMHGVYAQKRYGEAVVDGVKQKYDTDGIVYVYGTIDAPYACRLPNQNIDSDKSSIYLWDYTQEFARTDVTVSNFDEHIGSVIKYDEALGNVELSSDDEGFVALERDGRIYYGAYEGNKVTVSNCDPSVILEIQDARGNVLEVQEPAATHTFTVPTTFEGGEAEQLGIYLTVHKHVWAKPSYTWSDDNSTVTATHVCKIVSSHKESETVDTVRKVTSPTCTKKGKTVRVAKFKNKAFKTQTKTISTTQALGHTWGKPTYTWETRNDGKKVVTAKRVCKRDGSHVETETVVASAKVTKKPTETAKGTKLYTATFKNPAFETQTEIEVIPATGPTPAPQQPAKKPPLTTTTTTTSTKLSSTGDLMNPQLIALLSGMGFSLFIAGVMAKRKHAR